jgi:hypothetical protein
MYKGGVAMAGKFAALEDLIEQLEEKGHDLKNVIVDLSHILIPWSAEDEEE